MLLGAERVRIDPGNTAVTPLAFEWYPYSHSLEGLILWGAIAGAIYWLIRRSRAWAGESMWVLVIWAWWVDRHRVAGA